ncbi:hypothetical protein LTR05_003769 [Lithohypha guttulata]|uniref:Myosin-binding domain-containing protein n=1 Tax=Lithohypha guttulata TaxID=1690604 RepID=A0AAN7T0M0_9EURO|nr:hypothetical protein LTR05_003769 [Lithohypha guttulata]
MNALIYEDSPLAELLELEGEAVPTEIAQEETPPSFAPRSPPNLQDRLRTIRRSATSIQPTSSEQILEQFRYLIVASHLLSDDAPSRPVGNESRGRDRSLVYGAATTVALSFITAWGLHWLRTRGDTIRALSKVELALYCTISFCLGVAVLLFVRHQYSKYVQKTAAASLTRLVNDSHSFDVTAGKTLRFIQEIELVARGYDIASTPLPPISRLEDRKAIRRCQKLRTELAETLNLLITLYVESHNILQSFVVPQDLQRYHDIYEISLAEYSDAIRVANESSQEASTLLKELRFASRLHAVARKVFLCDLLALRTTHGWHRVRQWRSVQMILREIEAETFCRQQSLESHVHEEEFGVTADLQQRRNLSESMSASPMFQSPRSKQFKLQMRRFEDVAQGVRALNAKIHVFNEELSGLESANTDEAVLASALTKHYEALGTDIRALQTDWDRGKSSLLLNISTDYRLRPGSLSPRTPVSPSPGQGGFTIVDAGTPADALRHLNGDDRSSRSSDATLYDEEVFEAISKPTPRKRMSMAGMTRDEKIAKLNEERRKRATIQEQSDTTTNMLRELQIVLKHRPHTRSPSTPTTPLASRIVSL